MNDCKRVRYKKSPLIEVIYQLRFPTILTINTQQPAVFQEKIREKYPFYNEELEQQNEITFSSDGNPTQVKRNQSKNYSFISSDSTFKINLTSSFISFSTVSYTQWEDFRSRINEILPIFEEIYNPSFYTRVGLRYIDAFTRGNLDLQNKKWNELIKPHILGIMTSEIEDGVTSFLAESEYSNPDEISKTKVHIELVHINDNPENSMLIDCDYFTQNITQKSEVERITNLLHDNSSAFIRNAITPVLNNAMEPEEI